MDEPLAPDRERLAAELAELAGYADGDQPGWTRSVFGEPYRASREWVAGRMAAAGLQVHRDASGSIIGRLPGERGDPPLVTGSHTDTVAGGGRFDGVVGLLGAIEAARRIQETGRRLRHDLLVCDFFGEEANEYGTSCLGSRALTGAFSPGMLDRVDESGSTLGAALTGAGVDPDAMLAPVRITRTHAYVELHIEQGRVLERRGLPVGVVTGIAGIERFVATFTGRRDHAGGSAMQDRKDALAAAAEAVLTVERVGCGGPVHAVATTGRLTSAPGSWNVVPGDAGLHGEMRSTEPSWLDTAKRQLADEIVAGARARGVEVELDWSAGSEPVCPTDDSVQDVVAQVCAESEVPWCALPSGASHDAVHLARTGPMGMVFVPSRDGRSHCPEEWTELADICTGVQVLTETLRALDTT